MKDTTQKITMWLGTFETAEEAARAYDEAACLLCGANTRTNFITHVSLDSPLASRIRNLFNNRKGSKQREVAKIAPTATESSTSFNSASCSSSNFDSNENSLSSGTIQDTQLFDNTYRPDLSNRRENLGHPSYISWGFGPIFYQEGFPFAQVLDIPKTEGLPVAAEIDLSEFERMKVERQISASLYAINGVQEYMETVQDSNEVTWDLPSLCPLFC